MTDVDRVYDWFSEAAEMSGEEQAAFLESYRGSEPTIVRQLQQLLSPPPVIADKLEQLVCIQKTGHNPPHTLEDGSDVETGFELTACTVIGPYKLLEPIGEGGMGVVYLAQQSQPVRRKVAIKLIKPGMNSRQVIARFEAERQALAMMDHPSIARVLDAGTTDHGYPFFVMELVHGIPITEYCDRARMPIRQRLELVCDACSAIQHAHNKGIIHRDIKPSNVLVTENDGAPLVKVIDFGVAKALTENLTDKTMFTGVFQMIGTPLYMSPEQASFSNFDVDTRSDVYSLGVLLYEQITGMLPIDRESIKEMSYEQLRHHIENSEPLRPSRRLSAVKGELETIAEHRGLDIRQIKRSAGSELDWIVMKAIEKDRRRRYQSARELGEDVRRYLRDEAVEACPPSFTYRMKKTFVRHRVAALTGIALVAGLLMAVAGTSWQAYRATAAEAETQRHLAAAKEQETKAKQSLQKANLAEAKQRSLRKAAEQSDRESRWSLYVAKLNPMNEALREKDYRRLQSLLAATTPAVDEPDYRGWEWYYLDDQLRQSGNKIAEENAVAKGCIATSESRRLLATGLDPNEIGLWHLDSKKLIKRLQINAEASSLAFSDDGTLLAVGDENGEILLLDTDDFQKHAQIAPFAPPRSPKIRDISWTFDSQRVAFCDWYGNVGSVNANGKAFQYHRRSTKPSHAGSLDWHPSKPWLAAGLRLGERRIFDVDTGTSWALPRVSAGVGYGMRWNPSGKRLAFADQTLIRITNADGTDPIFLDDLRAEPSSLVWINDEQLVSVAVDRSVQVWDVRNRRVISTRFMGERGAVFCAVDRPGQTIYFSDGSNVRSCPILASKSFSEVKLAAGTKIESESLALGSSPHSNPITRLKWSPDNTKIAVASEIVNAGVWSGTVGVVDASSGRLLRAWDSDYCKGLAWSHDGIALLRPTTDNQLFLEDYHQGLPIDSIRCDLQDEPKAYWSPDKKRLAAYGGNVGLVLREPRTMKEIADWTGKPPQQVLDAAWSNDGERLMAAGHGRSVIFVDGQGNLLGSHPTHEGSLAVAWHPSDDFAAFGGEGGNISILRSSDFQEVLKLEGHRGAVKGVDFSPCGRRIASASTDGTVRLWDVATGDELLRLQADGIHGFCEVAWSDDGVQLVAGTTTRDIIIWGSNTLRPTPPNATTFIRETSGDEMGPASEDVTQLAPPQRRRWRDWHSKLETIGVKFEDSETLFSDAVNEITKTAQTEEDKDALANAWLATIRGTENADLAVRLADELISWLLLHYTSEKALALHIHTLLEKAAHLNIDNQLDQRMFVLATARQKAEQLVKMAPDVATNWRILIAVHLGELRAKQKMFQQSLDGGTEDQVAIQSRRSSLFHEMGRAREIWERIPPSCRYFQPVSGPARNPPWLAPVYEELVLDAIARGSWKQAADMGSKWVSVSENAFFPYYATTLLHAFNKNSEAAIEVAGEMQEALSHVTDLETRFFVHWTATLVPLEVGNYDNLIALAEDCVRRNPNSSSNLQGLGHVLSRSGQHERAAKLYEQSENVMQPGESTACVSLFQAMNQWHLGNRQVAKQQLSHARKLAEIEFDASPPWNRELTIRLFLREAENLIRG